MMEPDRYQDIVLILSDVDGVLTDGGIEYDNQGIESKKFHARDGLGISLWQRAGNRFGIVTARSSQIVKTRAAELGIETVRQGFEKKQPVVKEIIEQLNLSASQVAFIGDDLPDLAAMKYVGLAVAVADAAPEVREVADLVTTCPGGTGAVRETVETILKAQGRWAEQVARFL